MAIERIQVARSLRLPVRFTLHEMEGLRQLARELGTSRAGAVRLLVDRGLRGRPGSETPDTSVALAALVAAEHALLMVASVLPEGQSRMRELGPQAALAAEQRLALFRQGDR